VQIAEGTREATLQDAIDILNDVQQRPTADKVAEAAAPTVGGAAIPEGADIALLVTANTQFDRFTIASRVIGLANDNNVRATVRDARTGEVLETNQ
jgi:hypothetical protein